MALSVSLEGKVLSHEWGLPHGQISLPDRRQSGGPVGSHAVTRVVNLRCERYTRYIGRAGRGRDGIFGNPYPIKPGETRASVIAKFRDYFYRRLETDPEFKAKVHALRGEILGCYCKPADCHGDVIAEYLDNLPDEADAPTSLFYR